MLQVSVALNGRCLQSIQNTKDVIVAKPSNLPLSVLLILVLMCTAILHVLCPNGVAILLQRLWTIDIKHCTVFTFKCITKWTPGADSMSTALKLCNFSYFYFLALGQDAVVGFLHLNKW